MPVPDDSALLHARAAYDPQKAREYYLRTRHLKGRHRGAQAPVKTGVRTANSAASKKVHAEVQARQAALEKRLAHLKDVLSQLVKEAKARSGVKTPTPKTQAAKKIAAATNKAGKGSSPLTARQKRIAAKKAKDRYDKTHKNQPKDKSIEELQKNIKEVEAKIRKIRAQLKDAVDKARPKSQSKTASNGR